MSDTSQRPKSTGGGISLMLKFSLLSLGIVGVLSIFMILFGDSDYKTKAITTFLLFAAFAFLSWVDVKDDKHPWYSLIGAVGNLYFVLMGMYAIWGGANNGWLAFSLPYQLTVLVLLTRLGVFGVQRMETFARRAHSSVAMVAQPSSFSIAALTVLLTIPSALTQIEFGELYWKVTAAVAMLTALALAFVLILNAAYSGKEKQKREKLNQRIANQAARQNAGNPPVYGQNFAPQPTPQPTPQFQTEPQQSPRQGFEGQGQPPQFQRPQQTVFSGPPIPVRPSWPVFPDGNPLPRTQSGRPDWMALSAVVGMHIQADAQWFPEDNQ